MSATQPVLRVVAAVLLASGMAFGPVAHPEPAAAAVLIPQRDPAPALADETTHLIRGLVRGNNPQLGGIEVTAYDAGSWAAVSSGVTDLYGSYSIEVPAGIYFIGFHDPAAVYQDRYWVRSSSTNTYYAGSMSEASRLGVGGHDQVDVNAILSEVGSPTTIGGTITGEGGAHLGGIEVRLYRNQTLEVFAQTVSTADGTYSLTVGGFMGEFRLGFRDPSATYASVYWGQVAGQPAVVTRLDRAFVMNAGLGPIVADAVLPLAVAISGVVTGAGGGPLAGIRVDVFDSALDHVVYGVPAIASGVTDASGAYSIAVPPSAMAYVGFFVQYTDPTGAYAQGWRSDTGYVRYYGDARKVVASSTSGSGIDVELPDAKRLSGVVTDSDGQPLAGIRVTILDTVEAREQDEAATTAVDGSYSVSLPPGTWELKFVDPANEYVTGCYDSAIGGFNASCWGAWPVTVGASNVDDLDVAMPDAPRISGHVTDSEGTGVGGVQIDVALHGLPIRIVATTTTAADGTYSVAVQPNDPLDFYSVRATDLYQRHPTGWYNASGFSYDRLGAGGDGYHVTGDVSGFDIAFPETLYVTGRVTNAAADPLPGIRVSVGSSYTTAGTDGDYAVRVIPDSYIVRFQDMTGLYAEGYYSSGGFVYQASGLTPVVIGPASATGIDVVMPCVVHITGVVTNGEGAGVGSVTVRTSYGETLTGEDGAYSLIVIPGSYTVYFVDYQWRYLDGYWDGSGFDRYNHSSVVVGSADVAGIDVVLPAIPRIMGRVTDSEGTGLAGIAVRADESGGGSHWATATTEADGTYALRITFAASYTVRYADPSQTYVQGYYGSSGFTTDNLQALPIAVGQSDVTGIDVAMPVSSDIPSQPTAVTGVGGVKSAVVSWGAPSSDGGYPILGYRVTSTPGGMTCETTGALACMVTGLSDGTMYWFRVTARNSQGSSLPSLWSGPVQVANIPGKPTGVTATAAPGAADVVWSAPSSDGGDPIVAYLVTAWPDGHTCFTSVATSCTVAGLTNGQPYTFTVTAANGVGAGPPSDPSNSVTPADFPGEPTGVTATAGDASAGVSWTAPADDGGSAITGYTVTSSPDGLTCITTGVLSCTVSGLTNGTAYTFTVAATNGVGEGPASGPSNSVTPAGPATEPGAPAFASGGGRDSEIVVSWGAAPDNGAPITAYTATASPGGQTCVWSSGSLTCTITGLVNGTTYTISVTATNSVGTGPAATASAVPRLGNSYVGLTPTRILDTGAGIPTAHGPITALHAFTFQVTNQYPGDETRNVPSNATAVTGVLSVSGATVGGYLSLTPDPIDIPTTSTLNFPARDNRATGVTITLGPGGTLSVTFAPTAGSTANVAFDVTGYFVEGTSGSTYFSLAPKRVFDSRKGLGQPGGVATKLVNGVHQTFWVTGSSGVPAEAVAVVANVTVTRQTSAGRMTVGPDPDDAPVTATVYSPAYSSRNPDNRATGITIKLGPGGTLSGVWQGSPGSTADLIVDISGYFVEGTSGAMYVPITPNRILDTRKNLGATKLYGLKGQTFLVIDRTPGDPSTNVPANAVAVTGTLTVTRQQLGGYLALMTVKTDVPSTSTLNFLLDNRATGVTVPLGSGGIMAITYAPTRYKTTHAVFDVSGYFVNDSPA